MPRSNCLPLAALFVLLLTPARAEDMAAAVAAAAGAPAPAPAALAPAPAPAEAGAQQLAGAGELQLTAAEVAKHSTEDNCWFIYSGKVFDVTQYLAERRHPPGNRYIVPWCGKDGTDEWDVEHMGGAGGRAKEERESLPLVGMLVA